MKIPPTDTFSLPCHAMSSAELFFSDGEHIAWRLKSARNNANGACDRVQTAILGDKLPDQRQAARLRDRGEAIP